MKKIFLLLLMSLFTALTVYGKKSPELADSINPKKLLQGTWKLDSIVLYQYSDNDSIEVNNDLLPEDPLISGVFDTLYFEGTMCTISAKNMKQSFILIWQHDGNILEFTMMSMPYKYIIIVSNENHFVLYRKYRIFDRKHHGNTVFYGVRLIYNK
jgi:hypothetical protein